MSNPEELNCIICFDIFTNPVTLVCGHSFCKDCIVNSLSQVPKCPLCKYPILGAFDFRINYALQKMVERYKEKDKTDTRISAETDIKTTENDQSNVDESPQRLNINRNEVPLANVVRSPAFEIINGKKYFFKHTLYKLELDYMFPSNLIETIMPGHTFVGYVKVDGVHRQRANLFELVSIMHLTRKGLEVIARCKDIVTIDDMNTLDLHDNEEFVRQHSLAQGVNISVRYVNGKIFKLNFADTTENDLKALKEINTKIVHFLNVLSSKNPKIFDLLKIRLNFALINNNLTYKFDQNPWEYINFAAALLDLSENHKKEVYLSNDPTTSIKILSDYLQNTTPDNDPIFIFNHTETVPFNKQWVLILIVGMLALLVRIFNYN